MHYYSEFRNLIIVACSLSVLAYVQFSLLSATLQSFFTYSHIGKPLTTIHPTMELQSQPSSHPQPFIIPPKSKTHTTSLILLHGTSTHGESFCSTLLAPFVSPSSGKNVTLGDLLPQTKFVFPSGRERRTTVLGGQLSNAWFDVWDFTDRTKVCCLFLPSPKGWLGREMIGYS